MMQVKTYETKVGSVRKYQFNYGRFGEIVLDDEGHEHRARLATDAEIDEKLGVFDRHLQESGQTSPSEHLHELAVAEMDRFPAMTYTDAARRVMNRNPQITRAYASESNGKVPVVSYREREGDVSTLINSKAQLLLKNNTCKTFGEAVRKILAESPALAGKYAAFTSADAARAV